MYRHFSIELITGCLRNVILTCSCSKSRFPLDTGCTPLESAVNPHLSSMPRFQTYSCSCHSSSLHIFHPLPTKSNRLRVSWKSVAETGADLRHLIRLLAGGFMRVESFAGEAHHSSCGMDSLCGRHESSTRVASQRGVFSRSSELICHSPEGMSALSAASPPLVPTEAPSL